MIISKLQTVRLSKGLTQLQLAESVCMHERTIQHIEAGNNTTANNAKRLAITLGVKLEKLV